MTADQGHARATSSPPFLPVLISLAALLVLEPVARTAVGRSFLVLALVSVQLAAVWMVGSERHHRLVTGSLAVLAAGFWVASFGTEERLVLAGALLFGALQTGFVAALVVRDVVFRTDVTMQAICEGVCGYLLLGLMWALVFALIETFLPGSFLDEGEPFGPGRVDLGRLIYFSHVTLSTVGYGDIAPASDLARSLSAVEAVTGQLYLATLIAGLVGRYLASGRRGPGA